MVKRITTSLIAALLLGAASVSYAQQHSVARQWNEALLAAIRKDFGRPTVHARNLFHVSLAMYDAWAVYDSIAEPFLLGKTVGQFSCPFDGVPTPTDLQAARNEAISYAAYRVIKHRFTTSPGAGTTLPNLDFLMATLGYEPAFLDMNYQSGSPAALGNYIGQQVINFGLQDGSKEQLDYGNLYYSPSNPPLVMALPGNPNMTDPNSWQPITLQVFIDQNGNVIPLNTPPFLTPEWGQVTPYSMKPEDANVYQRDGFDYLVYHDPGPPPLLDPVNGGEESDEYVWNHSLVSAWSSHLDPTDGVMWDISPASIGNIQQYPTSLAQYHDFYDFENGGTNDPGHSINPKTGQAYTPQIVARGDFARVLAEFWADGPNSETPPGHWFTILNYVSDRPELEKRFRGKGPILDDLEWDVKSYMSLGGALHDVAITVWGIKGWYDYVRPVSAIRYMAERGQSSDPSMPNYDPAGFKLVPGLIELVEEGDPLAGPNYVDLHKIKIKAWKGPNYIFDPANDLAGVDWILAEDWFPYQRPTFVTPPFAGFISGHSTFSRAAATVLTELTGDPFFPGGMGEFIAPQNQYLVFEDGPSQTIKLQWATYRDASDQCSLSRIWGGIHPPADDIPGRFIGQAIGNESFAFSEERFYDDADNDGYYNYWDCNDQNAAVNPGAAELCDALDNNCDGQADEGLPQLTYFADIDNDGFGDAATSEQSCSDTPPAGYVGNNTDCNDSNLLVNPNAGEVCDGIDNNCNDLTDDGLDLNTFYLDADNDGFGDAGVSFDTCAGIAPNGYVDNADDCNDNDLNIQPNAAETCDDLDNNCNGQTDEGLPLFPYFLDSDEDGFGDSDDVIEVCQSSAPTGYVTNNFDCDDANANANPDAEETEDGIDNNCNGQVDEPNATGELTAASVKLLPNPTNGLLTVQCECHGTMTLQLTSVDGRITRITHLAFNNQSATMDLGDLPQGVYVALLSDQEGNQRLVAKVVKM
jgi:hypothetical protein